MIFILIIAVVRDGGVLAPATALYNCVFIADCMFCREDVGGGVSDGDPDCDCSDN